MPDNTNRKKTIATPSFTRRSTMIGLSSLFGATSVSGKSGRLEKENTSSTITSQDGSMKSSIQIDEVLPGDKFGKIDIGPYSHSLQISGTRQPAWMIQPFNKDTTVDTTSYKETGSNIGYGSIPFAPGQVPILRTVVHFEAEPSSTTSLRLSIANKPGNVAESGEFVPLDKDQSSTETIIELSGKGTTQIYDEVYLTEFEDVVSGSPAGEGANDSEYPINTFIIEAKTDDPKTASTIKGATTVSLELEAL
ncbi:hypothetical protein [Natronococcus jeotgali]|uniref:hypothetical protein n=1 Tax=Natronococcus jeotgali TaxID=413812 RepID=UPI00126913BC|nr:hypothetical protein [Natronococcus jeotgali]